MRGPAVSYSRFLKELCVLDKIRGAVIVCDGRDAVKSVVDAHRVLERCKFTEGARCCAAHRILLQQGIAADPSRGEVLSLLGLFLGPFPVLFTRHSNPRTYAAQYFRLIPRWVVAEESH